MARACAKERRWDFLLVIAPLVLYRGTASRPNLLAPSVEQRARIDAPIGDHRVDRVEGVERACRVLAIQHDVGRETHLDPGG
jgi:hypothetical protein